MNLLPLAVSIPLGMGFVLAIMPKRWPWLPHLVANAGTVLLVVLSASLLNKEIVYAVGGWLPPIGITLVMGGFSGLMLLTVSVVSLAATLFSTRYMEQYTGIARYYALFMFMVAGMNGVIITGDLFNMYVFMEIAAIASYALVAFGCEDQELEAAFKYAILGSVASSCILLGIAFLYCQFGTLNMAHLARKLGEAGMEGSVGLVSLFSLILLVAGLGMKAALVPFHAWLPDAHPSAPAPISAMLSGVLIKAIGLYALLRVVFTIFGVGPDVPYAPQVAYGLMVLGTLSMVVGAVLAFMQSDVKRLLAYSSISHVGYVVLGVGVGAAVLAGGGSPTVATLAIVGGLFHLVNHAVFKSLLFLSAGAVQYRTGTRQLPEMGGLRERMPLTAGSSLVASLAIAGVPPFNGFVSKLLIILACVYAGYYGFAAWAVLVSIVTLALFMKVQRLAFFGPLPARWKSVREVPFLMAFPMLLLAALCFVMGALIVPGLRGRFFDPAVRDLTDRARYVERVLGPAAPAEAAEAEQPRTQMATAGTTRAAKETACAE
jgi:multicomponent Na+:H+ antiporter subunit D